MYNYFINIYHTREGTWKRMKEKKERKDEVCVRERERERERERVGVMLVLSNGSHTFLNIYKSIIE